jgi:RHS repeat-associated protein
MDELSGGSTQPIQLLSKDFIYQGESSLLVHDQGPPRVERIEYESSSNCLTINFNETINPTSIINSVEIEYGGNIITGSIEITGDNQIKFTPSANLSSNVDYLIRVKDIKDAAGKTIEVFSYNFELNQEVSLVFNYSILAKNTHSLYGNNSLMHGRDYEPEIGLYYFRNRYYHPQLGRFLQQDPMGYEDSQNLYQAFNQNPVNFTDPFGLFDQLHMKYYNDENYMKRLWHDNPPTWKDIDTMLTNLSRWTQHSVEGGINTVLNAAQGLLHTFNSALIYGYGDRDFVYYNFDFKEGFVKRLDTRSAGRKFLGMAGGDLIEGVGTTLKAGYKLLDHNISEDERMEYERTFFNGVGAGITIGRGLYHWRKSLASVESTTYTGTTAGKGPGRWVLKSRRSGPSLEHQSKMSGKPILEIDGKYYILEYDLKGVTFDDFQGGKLFDYKDNFSNFIGKDNRFYGWFRGAEELQLQALRQIQAAKGTPVVWKVGKGQLAAFKRAVGNIPGLTITE